MNTFKYIVIISGCLGLFFLTGCYDYFPTSKSKNWGGKITFEIVNYTGAPIDLVEIDTYSTNNICSTTYTLLEGNSSTLLFFPFRDTMVVDPALCREAYRKYRQPRGISKKDLPIFLKECSPKVSFSKEQLANLFRDTLSQKYSTCLFLYPDGALHAVKNTNLPWKSDRYGCADPQAPEPLVLWYDEFGKGGAAVSLPKK